jgi:hypothetical protein
MRPLLRVARHPASGLVLLAGLAVTWPLVHLAGCMTAPREASAGEPVATVAVPAPMPSASVPPASVAKPPPEPRLYAKTRFVWIKPEPGAEGWIGFLWTGGSVKLRKEAPRHGAGCATQWVPIEPRGWVCPDGERATLDPNDPVLAKIRPYAPKLESPWPHQYGESRGLARYRTLPTPEEQRRREWDLSDHLARVAEANGERRHESLLGVDLSPAPEGAIDLGPLPATIHEHRKRLVPTSTVAWSAETRAHGRSWLLGADYVFIAKDRVAPYDKVTFRGVHLGKDAKLPLAFLRDADVPELELRGDELVPTGKSWPRLGFVELTGKERDQAGEKYLQTRRNGLWVPEKRAVVPKPQAETPWGAPVGGADNDKAPPGRRTWMQTSVWQGWLIAYEGTKPVFVTLVAPGRGGTPEPGKPPIDTASTPVGTFKITGKFATATMEAPGELIHSDVPWTQNFSGPHALHGAYWHDRWGHRMSGGCVNASPIDAKWLYEFTEPPVPEGWHGVRWRPSVEPATTYVVHD